MSGGRQPRSAFRDALHTLKQRGCTLLVTGRVPDEVTETTVINLLGDGLEGRARVFALLDRDASTARERLALAGPNLDPAAVVSTADGARTVAADASGSDPRLRVRPAADDPKRLRKAVTDAIETVARRHAPLDPGTLRVSVDSLRPLLDDHDLATVEAFVDGVGEATRRANGMAHFVLPAAPTADPVRRVARRFDVVVDHRVHEGVPQHRWRLRDAGIETQWAPL